MPQVKVSDLVGSALNAAVAIAKGKQLDIEYGCETWLMVDGIADQPLHSYTPSEDWGQGGPIIQREKIELYFQPALEMWCAKSTDGDLRYGDTPLIAAMRCYVASKLGDTVDVPQEVL